VHPPLPAELVLPAGQVTHEVAPALAYFPAGQEEHLLVELTYLPAMHCVQESALSPLTDPEGQETQEAWAGESWYLPEVHDKQPVLPTVSW